MLHQSTRELVGEPFGRLTVRAVRRWRDKTYALCECACGTRKMVLLAPMVGGLINSCGCIVSDRTRVFGRASVAGNPGNGVAVRNLRIQVPMRARILAGLRREVMNARASDDPERARDAERMLESMGAEVPR